MAPSLKGGHPRLDDRKALTGILFILETGIPWGDLPSEDGVRLQHDLLATAAGLRGCHLRGSWNAHKDGFAAGQLAQRPDPVEFVEVDNLAGDGLPVSSEGSGP